MDLFRFGGIRRQRAGDGKIRIARLEFGEGLGGGIGGRADKKEAEKMTPPPATIIEYPWLL